MRLGLFLLIVLACRGAAAAEDVREQEARAELERELEAMTKTPQPEVEVSFEGPRSARYELVEGSFALDGVPLPFKAAESKGGAPLQIFSGQVTPGRHMLTVTLVYQELASTFVFNYASLKFKLPGRFSFDASRGLHLRLPIRVEVDEKADVKKRLQLVAILEADMLMEVEEGAPPSTAVPVVAEPDVRTGPKAAETGPKVAETAGPKAAETAGPKVAETGPKVAETAGPKVTETGPAVESAGAGAVGAEAAKATRPKRKRIKRHLTNLLQNLAQSTKEEAAAEAGRVQVVDEDVPSGEAGGTRPALLHSLKAALREGPEPSGSVESSKADPAPTPKGSGKGGKSKKGSKRSRSGSKSAQGGAP